MTQLDRVKEYMKGREKSHISEIATDLSMPSNSVRGILNHAVRLNLHFDRLGGGYYKLKADQKVETYVADDEKRLA